MTFYPSPKPRRSSSRTRPFREAVLRPFLFIKRSTRLDWRVCYKKSRKIYYSGIDKMVSTFQCLYLKSRFVKLTRLLWPLQVSKFARLNFLVFRVIKVWMCGVDDSVRGVFEVLYLCSKFYEV